MNANAVLHSTRKWLTYDDRDLGLLLKAAEPLTPPALVCHHGQQASEKAIKTALTFVQNIFPQSHDLWELAGIDTVALDPRGDGKEVRIADRVSVTHHPWPLEQLLLDQREAFRHG